ncbi:MAG: gamma-glutamyltransferase family protein [Anaerolineales bacterium]|nr:gamma-glutamyltransferase family protein [Anaerolineales bacterium]
MFKSIEINFSSRRSPVIGKHRMVAASQPQAVAAGLDILSKGGTAADAAVAVAAVLNVTEPTSTGIGGDCFALYYDAEKQKISALNGSGRAPAALTLEKVEKENLISTQGELPPFHPYTITVPGACAGWCDLADAHGRLSMGEILAPAIHLAEEGFPVAPITAYFWQRGVDRQLRRSLGGMELTLDGRAPQPGEIFRNPGLARTLRAIAETGKGAFYEGKIGQTIVSTIRHAGGCMREADLAKHASTWENPIYTDYRSYRIWECPPNGQGLAALLALNILEGFELSNLPLLSEKRLHLEIEAMRLAFADTRWYVADPAFNPAPLQMLLSKEYAAERRKLINRNRATLDQKHGTPVASSDTVYFCVVDSQGNACSFINSNYMGFGTGIVPAGYGFTLHNRGHNFSLDPLHPNALAPGKRPYHTIIPGMITRIHRDQMIDSAGSKDGELYAAFGVMGGYMQPQGHMQVVSGLLDDRLDPQAALDLPRFCIEDGTSGGRVALEQGISPDVIGALEGMGHPIQTVSGHERAMFGRGQIILKDIERGVLWGGSDPRADGCAMGL